MRIHLATVVRWVGARSIGVARVGPPRPAGLLGAAQAYDDPAQILREDIMYRYNIVEPPAGSTDYQPGVCNIGPAEIARRRMAGHIGLVASVVLLAALVATGAPGWLRLAMFVPAAGSASGYLQAMLHFCAGFGSRGVYNFGPVGPVEQVVDTDARARDRSRSLQIGLGAVAIGAVVAVVAALLPI